MRKQSPRKRTEAPSQASATLSHVFRNAELHGIWSVPRDPAWAVGTNHPIGGTDIPLIEHNRQYAVPSPAWEVDYYPTVLSGELYGVQHPWAVGWGYFGGTPASRTLVLGHAGANTWKIVPSASVDDPGGVFLDNHLRAVSGKSANDVWAAGYTDSFFRDQSLLLRWTGGPAWNVVPSPQPGFSNGLFGVAAIQPNLAWAVGAWMESLSGAQHTNVIEWDGANWTVVPSDDGPGTNESWLKGVTAVSATDAWAVGAYTKGVHTVGLALRRTGSSWKFQQSFDGEMLAVSASGSKDVWVVGNAGATPLVSNWDGSKWRSVPLSGAFQANDQLNAVHAIAPSDVWVAGSRRYTLGGHYRKTLTAHWDGNSWTVVPSP
jgi:hypothetical protein